MEEIYTALVTPFNDDFSIDFISLANLFEHLISLGNTKFVICGTTGEVSTLSLKEKKQIIKFVMYHYGDSVDFIFGVSGNNTMDVIEQIKIFDPLIGNNRFMVVVPYYNKPSQNGLFKHFSSIAMQTKKELVLYNVPSRCSINLENETIIKLVKKHPNITALKQAGNYKDILILKQRLPFFKVFIGNDDLLLEGIEMKMDGVISVCSHIGFPIMEEFFKTKNIELDNQIKNLSSYVFMDSSPSPVKYMLYKKGIIKNVLRLPLVPIDKRIEKEIDNHIM